MKIKIKFFIVFLLFILSFIFSILIGTESFSIRAIFNPQILSEIDRTILFKIRLPRVITSFVVGAGLSISGVIFQAILENPLAESYTLGISGGACLGICIGVIFDNFLIIPFCAFIGGILSISIVLFASNFKKFSSPSLILLGVVLNFIFSSLVLFLLSVFKNEKFQQTFIYLLGDLSSTPFPLIKFLSPMILVLSFFSLMFYKTLDILSIGEEKSITLGVEVEKEKRKILFIASLITALCVSLSGIIGFVGLIIPHIVRIIFGNLHKYLLPLSIFVGGTFLILSDTLSRVIIRPLEIPVGVITGFWGGLFFLFLLFKGEKIW